MLRLAAPACETDDMAEAAIVTSDLEEGHIPGYKAMWVGIYAELTEFALMFIVYFVARAHHPDTFSAGSQTLSTVAGTANTLIMLTSSFFVARAVWAIRANRLKQCERWLFAALLTGLGYPLVKFFEIRWNLTHGLDAHDGNIFHMTYYYLTYNHLVHVSWGLLAMMWMIVRVRTRAYSAEEHAGLVSFASYWHATDLIWLMIFPLFYVLR